MMHSVESFYPIKTLNVKTLVGELSLLLFRTIKRATFISSVAHPCD